MRHDAHVVGSLLDAAVPLTASNGIFVGLPSRSTSRHTTHALRARRAAGMLAARTASAIVRLSPCCPAAYHDPAERPTRGDNPVSARSEIDETPGGSATLPGVSFPARVGPKGIRADGRLE